MWGLGFRVFSCLRQCCEAVADGQKPDKLKVMKDYMYIYIYIYVYIYIYIYI